MKEKANAMFTYKSSNSYNIISSSGYTKLCYILCSTTLCMHIQVLPYCLNYEFHCIVQCNVTNPYYSNMKEHVHFSFNTKSNSVNGRRTHNRKKTAVRIHNILVCWTCKGCWTFTYCWYRVVERHWNFYVCIYFLLVDISITNCLLVAGMGLTEYEVVTIRFV